MFVFQTCEINKMGYIVYNIKYCIIINNIVYTCIILCKYIYTHVAYACSIIYTCNICIHF